MMGGGAVILQFFCHSLWEKYKWEIEGQGRGKGYEGHLFLALLNGTWGSKWSSCGGASSLSWHVCLPVPVGQEDALALQAMREVFQPRSRAWSY